MFVDFVYFYNRFLHPFKYEECWLEKIVHANTVRVLTRSDHICGKKNKVLTFRVNDPSSELEK